ncbi:hypothetical protein BAUCODRAFT_146107 [Baudoinia panamericana UAMH 10762]|uniref:Peptidase M48 domain-containing protein n=1 Tax=Baudoinia panamericana (strain UAMH 10762) TaxID=717646 RepID=M2NIC9_BAUPA|nr:uncharacterized protein BAUCODRAFT_146107 [Baudoinia panamericana UAMH 10762]EMC99129.1 hypothetical protein BAUCODRAFT_146107 [Baudoinia panamericana UAMH 10762]
MNHFMSLRHLFHTPMIAFATVARSPTVVARSVRTPFSRQIYQNAFRTSFERSIAGSRRGFQSSARTRRQAFNYNRFQGAQNIFYRWAARPTFYYEVGGGTFAVAGIYVYNLEPVPVSNRYRFRIIPYSWEAWMGQSMYQQTMQQFGRQLMPSSSREHRMVQRVLDRLIPHSGLAGEEWEVHVINDPMKNAFVIPGGKVFVFRGILDVAQGEDGLAAVLGHEIAHNVAHHAAERMSQGIPLMVLTGVLAVLGLDLYIGNQIVGLAFSLPGSRKQEAEADYIGLMMMAESCYDPHAAMGLWARMEQEEKGRVPPQFMSTHPSSHNRLEKIREWLPKAEEKQESNCGYLTGYASDFRSQIASQRW